MATARAKLDVSTHSRLKAAGFAVVFVRICAACFNTQPPEGGWSRKALSLSVSCCFNTQPPEGGWAGDARELLQQGGFNTQPPEGGWQFH